MDGWMDGLQLYILFNSMSVMSERWEGENERLSAMEFRLRLKRLTSPGIELGTTS